MTTVISNIKEGRKLSEKLKGNFVFLDIETFPDTEAEPHLSQEIPKGKIIIYFIFSTNRDFDTQVFDLLALLHRLRNNNNLNLVMPYLPYTRSQPSDKKFGINKLEFLLHVVGEFCKSFYVLKPHCDLSILKEFLGKCELIEINVTSKLIELLNNKDKDYVLVSPDAGFKSDVESIAKEAGKKFIVLKKERLSSDKVNIQVPAGFRSDSNDQYVILDDMASTGGTLLSAISALRKNGADSISCIVYHNVSLDRELSENLKKMGIDFFYTNSINHPDAVIDIIPEITEVLSST